MGWLNGRAREKAKIKLAEEKAEKRAEKKLKRKLFKNKKGFHDMSAGGLVGVDSFGARVDFTLLDPRTTLKDIEELCNIASKNGYYSVVVPPVFVKYAKDYIQNNLSGSVLVGSVVGFPLGNVSTAGKIQEAKSLIKAGADEIEVSINLSAVKMGDYQTVKYELAKIARICRKCVVKAIFETAYLEDGEIEKLVKICIKSKVDYIMTSSGYAPIGATLETVEKLFSLSGGKIGIKASGGIKTRMDAESYLRLGAVRIGTSRII